MTEADYIMKAEMQNRLIDCNARLKLLEESFEKQKLQIDLLAFSIGKLSSDSTVKVAALFKPK